LAVTLFPGGTPADADKPNPPGVGTTYPCPVKLFSRNASPDPVVDQTAPDPASAAGTGTGKGRPTPSRKEAEAQRKQTLKVPSDPKEARKAAKARAAEERHAARAALLAGDERGLPKRDAGPVRRFVRNYVDGRWAFAELFMPLALLVLAVGFLPWSRWGMEDSQATISSLWMVLTLLILVDTAVLLVRMNRELRERWPDAADRKGSTFYALMRVLQIRRLRLPHPQVRRNGKPVEPK